MKHIIHKSSKTLLIVLGWLLFFGLGIQIFLRVVDNQRLNNYFSYGLSVEAQIRNMFKEDIPDNSVLHAGWPEEEKFIERGTEADITFYGMSFSNHIADQMILLNEDRKIRKIDGPAAPLNHSVASFLADKDICESDVVVLGILDSSLKYLNAMTNDTIGQDTPMGSFYPVFVKNGAQLERIDPAITSFEELKAAVNDPELWEENLVLLKQYDRNYSGFLYKSNILDYTLTGRFIKRWYKSKHNENVTKRVFSNGEFEPGTIELTKELVGLFLKEAKLKGFSPVIILIETQKYGTALSRELSPYLESLGVDYLSTSDIASPDDSANYLGDGHLTEESNVKIARELDKTIKTLLNKDN